MTTDELRKEEAMTTTQKPTTTCNCPDDCNCRRSYRTNYCGCQCQKTTDTGTVHGPETRGDVQRRSPLYPSMRAAWGEVR